MESIYKYEHPFVAVDGVVLRYKDERLEVLLTRRDAEPEEGKLSLPGGFMDIDKRLDETLLQKVAQKTGVSDFFMEQLKTYDEPDRDKRGRILSVAYLSLTNDLAAAGTWYQISDKVLSRESEDLSFDMLAFDHGIILQDALVRLHGKFWYSDLPKFLLQQEFTARDVAMLYEALGGQAHSNFKRKLSDYVEETGRLREYEQGGRPATLYRWVGKGGK